MALVVISLMASTNSWCRRPDRPARPANRETSWRTEVISSRPNALLYPRAPPFGAGAAGPPSAIARLHRPSPPLDRDPPTVHLHLHLRISPFATHPMTAALTRQPPTGGTTSPRSTKAGL